MSFHLPLHGQIATVFGGTGFLGRYVVSRLAAAGAQVRVVTRYPQSAYFLKPCGATGQITAITGRFTCSADIEPLVAGSHIVVNCIGILSENKKNSFARIHTTLPGWIASAARAAHVHRIVHISALGVDRAKSNYAKSKLAGEREVLNAFPAATILRPSVIFGPEDDFFNKFAKMARISPALPLIGGGNTKFQPVFVGDVAEAVVESILQPSAQSHIYELAGPETLSFHQILERLAAVTKTKRALIPVPWAIARVQALAFSVLPNSPLTNDQITSLETDNTLNPNALTLLDLGVLPTALDSILPTYLCRYIPGGPAYDKKRAI